jgi:glycosyltransferase involved in cell wall biosynthesis
MHIGIIGTRGIPNNYGGFEQCAEFLAKGLIERGFQVSVYNSHNHPYQQKTWNGVNIIHCYDPEDKVGTMGQFIYDFNCIRDARKRYFDIILQLGYTSSSVWGSLLPKKSIVTTNMDGLEWKRSKFSRPVQKFLQEGERLAVVFSDFLISDSIGIQNYLKDKYNKDSTYIAYGAYEFNAPDPAVPHTYNLEPYQYNMLIARLEPENSIEVILDGVRDANETKPFIVVGKHETKYGEYLKNKFEGYPQIKFIGGIYNLQALNNLRYYSNVYFHGHTVGGTNPSLLEAMASHSLICANNNPFNKYILADDALYFNSATDVSSVIQTTRKEQGYYKQMIQENVKKIREIYNWDQIVNEYAEHFNQIYATRKSLNKSISANVATQAAPVEIDLEQMAMG